jgi:serine phosphatase RsbU (regulator of sigma subunit)
MVNYSCGSATLPPYDVRVPEADQERLDIGRLLEAVEGSPPIDAVDVLASELRRVVHAHHVSLLIADLSGNAVVRLSHVTSDHAEDNGRNERTRSLPLAGSVYEQVLFSQRAAVVPEGDHWLVLTPVTERGDAIGILELFLPTEPDAEVLDKLVAAGHALAYVLIASRRHTDVFEWGQRDRPFSLSAEIQRRLLPSSYTVEGGAFTLAGWLEPANNVGGDTFDYSLEREYLYASITDAMGHAEEAALLATLTVGSLRNLRRRRASPAEQADDANAALLAMARPDQFVSGQMIRVRLADGSVELVNAGHPPPYLVSAGQAAELAVPPGAPLGVADVAYDTQMFQLTPGDRLVLVTDGFLERNADLNFSKILEGTVDRHPRQVVRELADNVLQVTGGNLQDDATVLCIDWYGPQGERNAIGGASRARATES